MQREACGAVRPRIDARANFDCPARAWYMAQVMADGPEGAAEYMDDPEVREMMSKIQEITGKK